MQKALEENKKNIMSNASRNFQSVRSKISNAISGAVGAMIQQKIPNEQKNGISWGFVVVFVFC